MFVFEENKVEQLKPVLEKARNIVVIGHTAPDGDAVASVLSLTLAMRKIFSAQIYPVVPDNPPNYVEWFPHMGDLIIDTEAADLLLKADVIFCMDFNEPKRVNHLSSYLESSEAVKVLIDHHPQPDCAAAYVFSYPGASSTAEITYYFIRALGNGLMDIEIATYLFAGILTDTGVFIHNSADYLTMQVASDLLRAGVDKSQVIRQLYNNYSASRMQLMGYLLYKKTDYLLEYEAAIITLSRKEMKRFNFRFGDHENIVNLPLSVKEVEVSVFLMEVGNRIKVSLRSKGKYDVNLVAREYFSGGGHRNAAGGSFGKSISRARKFLIKEVLPNLKKFMV